MPYMSSESVSGLRVNYAFLKTGGMARLNCKAINKSPGVCENVDLQKATLLRAS